MKKLNVLIIFIIIFSIYGCSKPKDIEQIDNSNNWLNKLTQNLKNSQKNQKSGNDFAVGDFSNPKNPYEWVGIEHNKSLDFIGQYAGIILDDNITLTLTVKEPFSSQTTNNVCVGKSNKVKALSQKYWNEYTIPTLPTALLGNDFLSHAQEKNVCDANFAYF